MFCAKKNVNLNVFANRFHINTFLLEESLTHDQYFLYMGRNHLDLQKTSHLLFLYSLIPGSVSVGLALLFLFHHMGTVIFSSDYFELYSRQVLGPPTLHQHYIVFL